MAAAIGSKCSSSSAVKHARAAQVTWSRRTRVRPRARQRRSRLSTYTPDRIRPRRARVRGRLYNGLEQLAIRVTTNQTPSGTTHFIHDIFGNVIAETAGGGATGATGTVREYIWLPEAEISPTMGSRTVVDRPIAIVDGVNATPVTYTVHVDHLHRPVKMTNAAKSVVWPAEG